MLNPGEVHVWRVSLNRGKARPATTEEALRAARFGTPTLRRRYLRAHAALRAILSGVTTAPLEFALHEKGKPYLASAPEIRFNLAHSRGLALVVDEVFLDYSLTMSKPETFAANEECLTFTLSGLSKIAALLLMSARPRATAA